MPFHPHYSLHYDPFVEEIPEDYDPFVEEIYETPRYLPSFPARRGQLTESQLRRLPNLSILRICHLTRDDYKLWSLLRCDANTFTADIVQNGRRILSHFYYSDFCLRPYTPGNIWNPANWVELHSSPRWIERVLGVEETLDWRKVGF